ncbi:MAG: TonB-dependent receptor [Bacteroidota bacterium]|nr:TonB-dependent receptor [Bacteroidota bacterium]
MSKNKHIAGIIVAGVFSVANLLAQEDTTINLLDMSLEELLKINVITASGNKQPGLEAPATIVVITAEEIKKRGYTDLTEIITDLPGFDVVNPNGRGGIVAYQRGYRTPITQRTLLMINGIIDNDLWAHEALLGKHYPIYNIERIEVLYGPTSSLYGPNAFLGIINIITKDGSSLNEDGTKTFVSMQGGSYNTKSVELATIGKKGDVSFSLAGKFYRSDEADLSGKWGFLSNKQFSDTAVWGPVLQHKHLNVNYGKYYSPADNYGVVGHIIYKNIKIGFINWKNREGYGSWYAADRAQNNALWKKSSFQLYLENNTEYKRCRFNTLLLFRKNRVWGDWAEAEPDWNTGMEQYSYISITNWNAINNSYLFKEDFTCDINKNISLQAGGKYERKQLTKAYDIPGYWDAFSSTIPTSTPGPQGYGAGIGHSKDSTYDIVVAPHPEMPAENLLFTDDAGTYLQFLAKLKKFRFNAGGRFDYNSIYGINTNIRASTIYLLKNKGAVKLIYGEAYQEPPPRQLFGGWNGRKANVNLKPEKAQNFELASMYSFGSLTLTGSLFYSMYRNVIKEEAENAGKRKIYGAELKSSVMFKNFIPNSAKISGYCYYSYTQALSSIHYNHTSGEWENGEVVLGDIAPHKVNIGINLPVLKNINLNVRGNYVSDRLVYSRNALREKEYKIGSYFTMDGSITFNYKVTSLVFKIKNITNIDYFHPGLEQADSGDDFTKRSLGYRNSLLPQAGRSFMISLNLDL